MPNRRVDDGPRFLAGSMRRVKALAGRQQAVYCRPTCVLGITGCAEVTRQRSPLGKATGRALRSGRTSGECEGRRVFLSMRIRGRETSFPAAIAPAVEVERASSRVCASTGVATPGAVRVARSPRRYREFHVEADDEASRAAHQRHLGTEASSEAILISVNSWRG